MISNLCHGTKVKTDILNAIDNTEVICLVLLDLSAAFDTVNDSLLLNKLKFCFGFRDTVLKWVSQYLTGRSQRVIIDGVEGQPQGHSDYVNLNQGVPQGSVLGPILLTLYISPLGTSAIMMESTFMVMQMTDKTTWPLNHQTLNKLIKTNVLILYNHVWQISEC